MHPIDLFVTAFIVNYLWDFTWFRLSAIHPALRSTGPVQNNHWWLLSIHPLPTAYYPKATTVRPHQMLNNPSPGHWIHIILFTNGIERRVECITFPCLLSAQGIIEPLPRSTVSGRSSFFLNPLVTRLNIFALIHHVKPPNWIAWPKSFALKPQKSFNHDQICSFRKPSQ